MRKKKQKRWLRRLTILLSVFVVIFGAFGLYCADYYKATDNANKAISDKTFGMNITEHDTYYSFTPVVNLTSSGVIFYPGGKVEAKAYAPLCLEIAKQGYYVALVKMPFNLAMFGSNRANKVIKEHSDIKNFYLAGHSLGGVFAASYTNSHKENVSGLVLLASYTTSDLSNIGIPVVSLYGSNDKVMNKANYDKNKKNLPKEATEIIIDGGIHSYFGDYGMQKGDGEATITREKQISDTVTAISLLISLNAIIKK